MKAPKLGVIASRNIPPGLTQSVIESIQELTRSKTIFVGGWHAPIEKEIHEFLVKRQKSHIHVCAKDVDKLSCELCEDETLFVSHCQPGVTRISRENALQRNRFICELSDILLIPWLNPIGKTHNIVLEFCKDMPIFVLDKQFNSDLIKGGAHPYNYSTILSILEADDEGN